jgi:hypothetical protein
MIKRCFQVLVMMVLSGSPLLAKKFYWDDPLPQEPKPVSLGDVQVRKLGNYYDYAYYSLATPGELNTKQPVVRSRAINTLGEPMDGAWYTHRHYWHPMSLEELARGAGGTTPPSTEGLWTVVSAKTQGVTPGFAIVDAKQRRYFVKFDPLSNPEMATAADMISARFLHALGYHVYDSYLVYFDRSQLILSPEVEVLDVRGRKRKMTERDLNQILLKAAKTEDGKYRALATLALPGQNVGPFLFHGRRWDDQNDSVSHEHRRDLRGYYVFCAWLNHDDSRAQNTLDTVLEADGVRSVRHHLIDFGATLGSATTRANSPRAGGEYLFSWGPTLKEMASLGAWVPHWAFAKYPHYRSIGRFEAEVFDPERWYPEFPNPAFLNRLPDDEFWAAKQVMAFSADQIRAVVKTGQISDPAAEQYLVDCLIQRRDKIGKAFFAKVLPLDLFTVRNGELAFEDLAKKHGLGATGPLKVSWSRFDNETEQKTPWAQQTGFRIPVDATPNSDTAYSVAEISREGEGRRTVTVYVRIRRSQPEVVGVERSW